MLKLSSYRETSDFLTPGRTGLSAGRACGRSRRVHTGGFCRLQRVVAVDIEVRAGTETVRTGCKSPLASADRLVAFAAPRGRSPTAAKLVT